MKINNIEITELAIESLRDIESVLADEILQHYDKLEIEIKLQESEQSFDTNERELFERAIKRDSFKLSQVKDEITKRFQTELLSVLDNDGLKVPVYQTAKIPSNNNKPLSSECENEIHRDCTVSEFCFCACHTTEGLSKKDFEENFKRAM